MVFNPQQFLSKKDILFKRKYKYEYKILHDIGKRYIEVIQEEIKKDLAKRKGILKEKKETLPDTKEFLESFEYRVAGQGIEISTRWPFLDRHLEGRSPYKMSWLRGGSKKNPKVIPIWDEETKEIKFRKVPFFTENSWIHPGVAKSFFLERAKERMEQEEIPNIILNASKRKR